MIRLQIPLKSQVQRACLTVVNFVLGRVFNTRAGQFAQAVRIAKWEVLCLAKICFNQKRENVNLTAFSRTAGGWLSQRWCLRETGRRARQMWFEYFPERGRLSRKGEVHKTEAEICILTQILPPTCSLGLRFIEERKEDQKSCIILSDGRTSLRDQNTRSSSCHAHWFLSHCRRHSTQYSFTGSGQNANIRE